MDASPCTSKITFAVYCEYDSYISNCITSNSITMSYLINFWIYENKMIQYVSLQNTNDNGYINQTQISNYTNPSSNPNWYFRAWVNSLSGKNGTNGSPFNWTGFMNWVNNSSFSSMFNITNPSEGYSYSTILVLRSNYWINKDKQADSYVTTIALLYRKDK